MKTFALIPVVLFCISKSCSKTRRLSLLTLIACLALAGRANAMPPPTGISTFDECVELRDDPVCTTKTVVTLPVSYGLTQTLDVVYGTGTTRIEISKTPPTIIYPLNYFHTVTYAPYEQVVKVQNSTACGLGCLDGPYDACPTCGWQYDGGGLIIKGSQGFCSRKDLDKYGYLWWRGEELFGEQASLTNPFSTSHCLRMGDILFQGYEIGRYKISYDISVKVTNGASNYTFKLTPNNPVYSTQYDPGYSGDFQMKADLAGNMAPYQGDLELDNYILYIPAYPVSNSMVQDYQHNMLLVLREEVSKVGSELDKVGISYSKFREMAGLCAVSQAGDGLGNQLVQKHNTDIQKLAVNPDAETTYLVHGKNIFKGSMSFTPGMDKSLQHKIVDISHSLVSLTLANSGIVKISTFDTESRGVIRSAEIQSFESFSTTPDSSFGLFVVIGNAGDLKSNYIVAVTTTDTDIVGAIPAQARTLSPQEEVTLRFDISTTQNLEAAHNVWVTLKSPTGKIYDTVQVFFNTTKHGDKYPWDLYMKNTDSVSTVPAPKTAGDITCDGQVNTADLSRLAADWLKTGSFTDLAQSPNCDSTINILDFSVLADNWQI